jgi:hypothetical protein
MPSQSIKASSGAPRGCVARVNYRKRAYRRHSQFATGAWSAFLRSWTSKGCR